MKNNDLYKTLCFGLLYGLYVKTPHGYVMVAEINDYEINGTHEEPIEIATAKPILRPLDDLKQEVSHKGYYNFIPIHELKDQNLINLSVVGKEVDSIHEWIGELPLIVIGKLLEWHFNVFNLPEDQYIAVTNEFNPYE